MSDLVEGVARGQLTKEIGEFAIGDTVDVQTKIVEGERERLQIFTGTVIARKGRGINETFTVRRIVSNEGVERIFPLHSPNVVKVAVRRSGHTRRSKLYFLRNRVGKATRLREKWEGKDDNKSKDDRPNEE